MTFFRFSTITLSLLTLLIFLPTPALAQNFVELVGIPYIDKVSDGSGGLGAYANSLYLVAISIAAILAVLKIVIAGVKYMVTDIVTTKGQAKNDIKNALLGLLVVVGAFLILETINPDLTRLTALNLDPVTAQLKKHKIEKSGDPVAPENNLDSIDLASVPNNQKQRVIDEFNTNTCKPGGGSVVITGSVATCRGGESTSSKDNIINTQQRLSENLSGKSASEIADITAQYNTYVGPNEPNGLSQQIVQGIIDSNGADDVVFIVNYNGTESQNTAATFAQQEAVCEKITGSNNIVIEGNYAACLK